jgi:hypothetical protein
VLTGSQLRDAQKSPAAYVLDTRGRTGKRAPDPPVFAAASFEVCGNCDKTLARELRCDGCPMTRMEDGELPRGARLVRY